MPQPRFIFRLEPLLDLRKRAEKDKQIKLAEVQQRIAALVRQIQEAETSITRQNRYLSAEKLVGTLDLTFISHEKRYVGSLQLQIAQCLQKIAAEEVHLTLARRELLAAARDRKIIEKLREKQYARWLADQARIEAAFTDEIGTQLALRRMSEAEQL
jgi:flagellar protein FliJ